MQKKLQQSVKIKRNEENPEPMEVIAKAIIDVSRGFKKINEGQLSQRVVVLLIKDLTGLAIADIERVLNAAAKLERVYIKQNADRKMPKEYWEGVEWLDESGTASNKDVIEFAEWILEEEYYTEDGKWWMNAYAEGAESFTTADLHQLWQQSKGK